MHDSPFLVQVLQSLSDLFDNNLRHIFLDSELPTLVIIGAKEASEVAPVAMFQHKVIVLLCPIFSVHSYYSMVLHF
jgi:hypothetical protein